MPVGEVSSFVAAQRLARQSPDPPAGQAGGFWPIGYGIPAGRTVPDTFSRARFPASPRSPCVQNERAPAQRAEARTKNKMGQLPTLPPGCPGSTIGAGGLNFSVRNGKRCDPSAIATPNLLTQSNRDAGATGSTSEKNITGQASRLISTGRLKSLRTLYLPPIDVVISNEPLGG